MMDFDITQLFATSDFSRGREAFAESLLQRALAELPQENDGRELADEEIEWLAAAGQRVDPNDFQQFDD